MTRDQVLIDGVLVPLVRGGDGSEPADTGDAGGADPGAGDVGSLSDAASSMEARLAEGLAGVQTDAEGNVVEPAGAPAPPPAPAGDEGDMTYRDAQALRAEQQQYRERWGGFEQAFSGVSDDARARLLERAPDLGDDLAEIADAFATLAPDDRAIIAQVIGQIESSPEDAAHNLMAIAGMLRGDEPGAEGGEQVNVADDGEEPEWVSREELDALINDRLTGFLTQHAIDQEEQRQVEGILTEVKDLGYDLESEDPIEQARGEALFALARRLGGDLTAAHEALSGVGQRSVDEFVNGKAADAGRPGLPGAGAPPSQERPLETMDDAEGAMRGRLDAMFGPSTPRP